LKFGPPWVEETGGGELQTVRYLDGYRVEILEMGG
jgi:hypothetical protein